MRLQKAYYICRQALGMSSAPIFNNVSYLQNPADIAVFLHTVEELAPITDLCMTIYRLLPSLNAEKEEIRYSIKPYVADSGTVQTLFQEIRRRLTIIRDFCEFLGVPDQYAAENDGNAQYGFDIKLPPNLSFRDLSKCVSDMDKIFSTYPVLREYDGGISYQSTDIGSTWLTFAVVASATVAIPMLKCIAELVNSAIKMRANTFAMLEQQANAEKAAASADMLKKSSELYAQLIELGVQLEVDKIAQNHNITDHEDRERIKYCLGLASDWINKGMEVHAGLGSPSEVKTLFPPDETQSLPEHALKLLAGHSSENETPEETTEETSE